MANEIADKIFEPFFTTRTDKPGQYIGLVRENIRGPEAQRLRLVVLDMLMPGMDGLETLSQLRAICPDIPVLILSAHVALDDAMCGLDYGAYDYILKPVGIETLKRKMAEAIDSVPPPFVRPDCPSLRL